MKEVVIQGKLVKLYDSIDEMPIINFQRYNKFLLFDSGIGCTIDDVDSHIVKIAKLMQSDTEKAMQELQNLRNNLHMINSNISPKYLAFAALIHSVDGKEFRGLSDSELEKAFSDLKEAKHSFIVKILDELKKKVSSELELYFPSMFSSAKERNTYDDLRLRTLLILNGIAEHVNNTEKIKEIDNKLLSKYKPRVFSGEESIEIKGNKQFENVCMFIAQNTSLNAKDMTVLQFYTTLETLEKQLKSEKDYGRR